MMLFRPGFDGTGKTALAEAGRDRHLPQITVSAPGCTRSIACNVKPTEPSEETTPTFAVIHTPCDRGRNATVLIIAHDADVVTAII